MEVITIERNAWEQLLQAMQVLTARVEMLLRKCQDRKLSKWLDNDEVCELLRISPRTLQELRSKHKIGYAQIGRKFTIVQRKWNWFPASKDYILIRCEQILNI